MVNRFLASLILSAALFAQGGGQQVNIPVTESGWKFGTGTGPYGTNGCYSGYNTGKCSQDLGRVPQAGVYVLTFTVLNRYYSYPSHYTAEIRYGTQELCHKSGWAIGDVTQDSLPCPSPQYLIADRELPSGGPPQGANHLVLSFSVSYELGLSDNYSLTFTPTN